LSEPVEDVVEFGTISVWSNGEENAIEYFLPVTYEEEDADWIGVYKVSC
jgi:SKICH domain